MSACDIFIDKSNFKIVTQSLTNEGILFSDNPVFIIPFTTDLTSIKNIINESLDKSRINVNLKIDSDEFDKHTTDLLNKLSVKSYTELYKKTVGFSLEKIDSEYLFRKYKFFDKNKPSYGLVFDTVDSFSNLDDLLNKLISFSNIGNIPN